VKYFALIAVSLVFIIIALGQKDPEIEPVVREFHIIVMSIILEAVPFILIGSLAGGIIEVFVSRDFFARIVPRNPFYAACLAAVLGAAFPVCECGIIPVVRRLTRKGVPAFFAVTYMLAAPIINPVVAASTVVAYKGDASLPFIVAGRMAGGFLIAVTVGLVLFAVERKAGNLLLPPSADDAGCSSCVHACTAIHDEETLHRLSPWKKMHLSLLHAGDDFFEIGTFLFIGAAIAGLLRSVPIPTGEGNTRLVDIVMGRGAWQIPAMMILAFVLSLCSEADAFFSRAMPVTAPARLAFLVTGPMIDVKLLLMYGKVFTKKCILLLVFLILSANGLVWFLLYFLLGMPSNG